ERFAYYGARSIVFAAFQKELPSISSIVGTWTQLAQFAPLVGAAIVVGVGPRIAALLGGIAMAAGLRRLGIASGSAAINGSMALLTIGSAVLYLNALSVGVDALRPWGASGIAAAAALAFGGIDAGASFTTWLVPMTLRAIGHAAFIALAALALL